MRKFLLLIALVWVSPGYSQKFNTTLTSEIKVEDDVREIHKYGKNYYSSKINPGKAQLAYTATLKKVLYGVELTKYDENFNTVKKLSIDNDKRNFGPFMPMVHFGKDLIYVIYFQWGDHEELKVHVAKVDPEELTIIATKAIMEYNQKNKGLFGLSKVIEDAHTFYTVSQDGQRAWIVHASPTQILNCVIDGDLNIIEEPELIPISHRNFSINDSHIGNDGKRILAYRYNDDALDYIPARGIFFQYPGESYHFVMIKPVDGNAAGPLSLHHSNDGKKLYIGGEYASDKLYETGAGVMLAEIDLNAKSYSKPSFYPYSPEVIQTILDLKYALKKKGKVIFKEKLGFWMTEMSNGTIVMSTDIHKIVETPNKYIKYYTGPIIHAFIPPTGGCNFAVIAKDQPQVFFTQYFNFISNDKMICIYADHPKAIEKNDPGAEIKLYDDYENLMPVANIYDSNGNLISRQLLIGSGKEIKGNVMIPFRSKVDKDYYIFPVGKLKANLVKLFTTVNHIWHLKVE